MPFLVHGLSLHLGGAVSCCETVDQIILVKLRGSWEFDSLVYMFDVGGTPPGLSLISDPVCGQSDEVVRTPYFRGFLGKKPWGGPRTRWRHYVSIWSGKTSWSPKRSWRVSQGRGMSGFLSGTCCLCDQTTHKQ